MIVKYKLPNFVWKLFALPLALLTAGLLAQGMRPEDAARLAVVTHALAGQKIVRDRGWRSLLASDLLDLVPTVLQSLARRARPTA